MNAFDLVISGGDAILPGRGRAGCDIAIRDGKIAAVFAPGEIVSAREERSARGLSRPSMAFEALGLLPGAARRARVAVG